MNGDIICIARYLNMILRPQIATVDSASAASDVYNTTVSNNPIIILLLINAILLVIGLFLDTVPAIIVMAPLLLPTVQSLGIDPIQFGVIMSVNLAIGLCSPPYGCNLFVGAAVAKIKMESMLKWIVPYFVLAIIALMLITFVEPLSMFLVG